MSKFFIALVIVFFGLFALINIQAPNACEEHVSITYPITNGYLVIDSIKARMQDDRLVSAIAFQTKDLTKEHFTFVCHFASMRGGDIELEIYKGNTLETVVANSAFLLFGYL
jgi:hypothetical protein